MFIDSPKETGSGSAREWRADSRTGATDGRTDEEVRKDYLGNGWNGTPLTMLKTALQAQSSLRLAAWLPMLHAACRNFGRTKQHSSRSRSAGGGMGNRDSALSGAVLHFLLRITCPAPSTAALVGLSMFLVSCISPSNNFFYQSNLTSLRSMMGVMTLTRSFMCEGEANPVVRG